MIPIETVQDFSEVAQHINGEPKFIVSCGPTEFIARAGRLTGGLFDFDGTLHPSSQWRVIMNRLPRDLIEHDERIRSWYWNQLHGKPAFVDLDHPDWFHGIMEIGNQAVVDGAWAASSIHMLMQGDVRRQAFQEVAQELGARKGAIELLELLARRAVVSYGLETIISDWLVHHQVTSAIAATRLHFNADGRLTDYHPNIVASPTKEHAANRFRAVTGIHERNLLVVGDSVVDIHMMHEGGFNVLILPPTEADRKLRDFRENNLSGMWARLTAILVSDSLQPLVDLINLRRG